MSIFQSTFPNEIQNQLKARGVAFKNKTTDSINWINSRQAWVRMTSGANIKDSSALAQNYILLGGVAQRFGLGDSFNDAYTNYVLGIDGLVNTQRGIKPMPGIESVSITSRNAYGSIRKATVKFYCHDIKQLEVLEPLFMRPGYTVLLEYGWAPYIKYLDNQNVKLENKIKRYGDVFDPQKPLIQIMYDLYNDSKKEEGNYEALLSLIENFEWNAREDGGYDCTVYLTSIGEAMESLKTNYSPIYKANYNNDSILYGYFKNLKDETIYPKESNQSNYSENLKKYKISILDSFKNAGVLTNICADLFVHGMARTKDNNVSEGIGWEEKDVNGEITGEKDFKMHFYRLTYNSGIQTNIDGQKNVIEEDEHVYIDLESFVKILNHHLMPNIKPENDNNKLLNLSLKGREYVEEEKGKDLECLYHFLQISVNPNVCLIRNDNFNKIKDISLELKNVGDLLSIDNINNINSKLDKDKLNLAKVTVNEYCKYSRENSNSNREKLKSIIENYYTNIGLQKEDKDSLIKANEYLENAWTNYKQIHYRTFKVRTQNTNRQEFVSYIEYSFIGPTDSVLTDTLTPNNAINNAVLFKQSSVMENTEFYLSKLRENREFIKNYTFNELMIRDLNSRILDLGGGELSRIIYKIAGINYNNSELRTFSKETIVDTNLKNKSDSIIDDRNEIEDTRNTFKDFEIRTAFLNNLTKKYFDKTAESKNAKIGGIYINLKYALSLSMSSTLQNQDVKEKAEINLYDFLKNLMYGVQRAIGNLNNFEIHVDPVDNTGRIIDLHYVDNLGTDDRFNKSFMFLSEDQSTLNNLYNNVRNYKMASQITKDLATTIAISAQADGGKLSLDNDTLVAWNKGITDRFKPAPSPQNYPKDRNTIFETIKRSVVDLEKFLIEFNSDYKFIITFSDRDYDSTKSNIYETCLRDLIMTLKAQQNTSSSDKAILPLKLNLTLDGIGGIIIGNMFRIPNELLPAGYKAFNIIGKRMIFLVTGINHEIKNNDWVTTLDTQIMFLEEDINKISEKDFFTSINTQSVEDNTIIKIEKDVITENVTLKAEPNKIVEQSAGKIIASIPNYAKALLDMIAVTEGTAGKGKEYDIIVTNKRIPNWNENYQGDHPNIYVASVDSTAAGRYQFLYRVWNQYGKRKGLKFNKNGQDLAGYYLLKEKRGVSDTLMKNAFDAAKANKSVNENTAFLRILDIIDKEWASLPNSKGIFFYKKQGGIFNLQKTYNIYLQAVKKY